MPELPEVQVVINYLNKNILNKKIVDVVVNLPKIIKNASVGDFIDFFKNQTFVDIKRRGKYLIFILDNKKVMVAHLRMEGKFFYTDDEYKIQKHDHIIFKFEKSLLIYNDTRQFGTMHIYGSINEAYNSESLKKLGYEPFDEKINETVIFNCAKQSKKFIKTFLLDQTKITGIGNIYADEILFAAKINPLTITNKISKKQWKEIIDNTKKILNESIKYNGTTIHSFKFNNFSTGEFQKFLKVHTKNKQKCPVCETIIKKIVVNGRGTYFCEKCQKKI